MLGSSKINVPLGGPKGCDYCVGLNEYNPLSKTGKDTGSTLSIGYGDGTVEGPIYEESIAVAGLAPVSSDHSIFPYSTQ